MHVIMEVFIVIFLNFYSYLTYVRIVKQFILHMSPTDDEMSIV